MNLLAGQVALVTGGGRGIGRAIAMALAEAGAAVAIVARSQGQIDETVAAVAEAGGQVLGLAADVTDRHAIESTVTEVEKRLGDISLLVNNAGVITPIGPIWEVDPDEWWNAVNVNLRGVFLGARAVLPGMIRRRRGRIVNIASSAALWPAPYSTAYRSSKAAVIRFTDCLALEVKEYGLSVFAVHPGTVRTEMTEYLVDSDAGRRWMPGFQNTFEQGRDVPPEQAARLVVTLASGKADVLSGRYLSALDDIDDRIRSANQIIENDLYSLRLRTP